MKYFGILNKEEIEDFNGKKIADFLLKNKLYEHAIKKQYYFSDDFKDLQEFEDNDLIEATNIKSGKVFFLILFEFMKSISAQLNEQIKNDLNQHLKIEGKSKINLNDILINEGENIKLEPSQILIEDFYESIVNQFGLKIINEKYSFYEKYNEEIFGLNYNKQKKITLKHYKEIYKSLFEDHIIYVPSDEYDNENDGYEIDFFKIENKIKVMLYNKLKYQHQLATLNPFLEYLTGDKSIFHKSYYIKHQIILDEVIKYEAKKEIMVELNTKYQFEEDLHFTDQNKEEKSIEDLIPHTNKVEYKNKENNFKLGNSKNNPAPFIDYIKHENKIEIEQIIKTHYSDVRGVSLRYLIEFLKEEGVLVLLHGDATKFYNAIKILLEGKNIGAYTSVFDSKVFSSTDKKYTTAKISFAKMFKDIL